MSHSGSVCHSSTLNFFRYTRAFGSDLCDRFFRQTRTWDSCLETIFVGDDSLLTYYVYSSEYDRYFCSADLPPSSVIYICISNCVWTQSWDQTTILVQFWWVCRTVNGLAQATGWRRPIGCLKLQVMFISGSCAENYSSLHLTSMTVSSCHDSDMNYSLPHVRYDLWSICSRHHV